MSRKSIEGSRELGQAIKVRRNELQMTIEEAANKAGVGTKTWCRYEAGESIRQDKCKGICKVLNWSALPYALKGDDEFDILQYRQSKYWSKYLEQTCGETAALSFIIGSEVLGDYINDDLAELAKMPRGSHIGEIDISFLADDLPPQFLTRCDYEFVYALKCALNRLKTSAAYSGEIIAHSVLEEIVLYMVREQSRLLIEEGDYVPDEYWDEWIFDLFGDADIITLLYSDTYVSGDNIYHFDRWLDNQFYVEG